MIVIMTCTYQHFQSICQENNYKYFIIIFLHVKVINPLMYYFMVLSVIQFNTGCVNLLGVPILAGAEPTNSQHLVASG